jgi:hypothetical protein
MLVAGGEQGSGRLGELPVSNHAFNTQLCILIFAQLNETLLNFLEQGWILLDNFCKDDDCAHQLAEVVLIKIGLVEAEVLNADQIECKHLIDE